MQSPSSRVSRKPQVCVLGSAEPGSQAYELAAEAGALLARLGVTLVLADGTVDIVVGTQLVTKGYHFPNLTLVGVVDADLGLAGGDLRAAERSFQQIQQVAGRAGRGDKPGRVLVQTHDPEAPVMATRIAAKYRVTTSEIATIIRVDHGSSLPN